MTSMTTTHYVDRVSSMSVGTSSQVIAPPDGLQRLFHDVRTHQFPRLLGQGQGVASTSVSDGIAGDLSDEEHSAAERELHETQVRIDAMLEDWSMDAIDLGNNAAERDAWARLVRQMREEVVKLKKEAQKVLLDAHRLRQERRATQRAMHWRQQHPQHSSSRDALFGDMATTQKEREQRKEGRLADQTSDDKLMTASGDVTAALQRTVKLMSAELEKSSYSAQLLDESTVSIQQATLQYTSFSDLVASSRKLISSMERADLIDAIILGLSMLFFAGCILYILKVRIWDRGVGIVSFFGRIIGMARTRSAADVSEKLRMAQAAKNQRVVESLQRVSTLATEGGAAASASIASAIASGGTGGQVPASDAAPIVVADGAAHPNTPAAAHDEL